MAEYFSLDRVESGIAVLLRDDKTALEVPIAKLPGGVCEGDCLLFENGRYAVDKAETERRRQRNRELLNRLKKK